MNAALLQLRLKHLQLLELIHATGSLRRVAAELCVTQPAVSAMLKDLERAFSNQLVSRDSQGARLTDAGHALRVRLGALLDELRIASGDMESDAPLRLRVGAMMASMFDLIPRAILRMYASHPRTEVRIKGGSIEQVVQALLHNEVDCVVGRLDGLDLDAETRETLVEEPLLPMPLGIACAPGHPLAAQGGSVACDSLLAYEWVLMPPGSQARTALVAAMGERGHHGLRPMVESESLVANFHMVANSTWLTVAPRSAIGLYRDMGVVTELAIDFPLAVSPIAFLCHRVKLLQPGVRLFRQSVEHVAREMSDLHGGAPAYEPAPSKSR